MSTELATEEILALDTDWDLIHHLAIPESVRALQGEQVSPTLIEDDFAREVFEWQMAHVRETGQPATGTVLEDEFEDVALEAPQTQITDLIERLRTRYMQNRGRDTIRSLVHVANTDPLVVGSEMMKAGRQLAGLVSKRGEAYGAADWHRALAHYDEIVTRGRGPTLGYPELDDQFNGVMGVTFLIAPPKRYKSWTAINALAEQILEGGRPSYVTLELPAVDVQWRLACMFTDTPYWKYLKGAISPKERKVLTEQMKDIASTDCDWVIEKPRSGERSAIHLVERALNRGSNCVIIDQLQYVETSRGVSCGAANNTGDYWEVCNALRDYSDEIPIYVVHQFNRSVMNADEMPEMQQAKGSSAIEEVGTLILGMWSSREMRISKRLEIGTLASRHFDHKSWNLGVSLNGGCSFDLLGEVKEDE